MSIGYFVTGTDTGVGKTRVGTALAHAWASRGLDVRVRKPVESGCAERDGGLHPLDAEALRRASATHEPLDRVCRYRLRTPVSPERAAVLEGVDFDVRSLTAACLDGAGGDIRMVEGAGGFYSPIARGALNADLAVGLELPVLLVASDRLGTLNQCLLSIEAIERRGLALAAVVLSRPRADTADDPAMDNAADLARWTSVPVHVLPFGGMGDAPWSTDAVHLAPLADRLAARVPSPR